MKRILLLIAGFFSVTISLLNGQEEQIAQSKPAGQIGKTGQMSFGYNMMLPLGEMKTGWSSAHGLQAEALIALKKWPALKIGLDGSFGMYGYNEQTQDYLVFNGILASSEVSFSSTIFTFGAKALLEPPKQMPVKPYASLQFGVLGMSSDLTLDDFWGSDVYCESQYQKTLVDDADWYAGIGGGIKFDLGSKKKPGRNFIDLSAAYLGGGTIKYANMNRMYNSENPPPMNHGDYIKVVFINTTTGERQEQQVAELYRQPINVMQIHVKYTFAF
jgi:hypothetical protein